MKAVLTPAEYAHEAGRSKSWVVERCQDGTLPALRIGSRWILKRADLVATGWLLPDGVTAEHEATSPEPSVVK